MILLDTQSLVWLAAEPRRLSRGAERAIRDAASTGGLGVASITLWEVAMMLARGQLRMPGTLEAALRTIIQATSVTVREITTEVAALSMQFPAEFPRDPADRLIAATAIAGGFPLVTKDRRLRAYRPLRTIW